MSYSNMTHADRQERRKAQIAHELKRREVWVAAWTATAQASNCSSSNVATRWADECLKQYDDRFKFDI